MFDIHHRPSTTSLRSVCYMMSDNDHFSTKSGAHSLLTGFTLSCCFRQNLYNNIFSKTNIFHEVQQTADLLQNDDSITEFQPCLASCLKHMSHQHHSSLQIFYFGLLAFSIFLYVQDSTKLKKIQKIPSAIAMKTTKSVEFFFVSVILILITDVDNAF